ncbi:MAG: DUF523 domain-containing protein [Clostridia bacterium]|nr:DUF523 domain-containing protein [Clostridia bacterium]
MKKNILVSACLLGEATRYDGKSVTNKDALRLSEFYNIIPICPEVIGGLPIPRIPSERVGASVLSRDGRDVTENFLCGAREAHRLFCENECELAVLKERSPSCGRGRIYDGSFSGTLTDGNGVTAELLLKHGVRIYGESEIKKLLTNKEK